MMSDEGQAIDIADDAPASVAAIMQQVADHKGCGT